MKKFAISFAALALFSLVAYADHPGYLQKDRWYPAGRGNVGKGQAIGANKISLYPFLQEQTVTIGRLCARVNDDYAGESFMLAIYANDDQDNVPTGSPVAKTGAIHTTGINVNGETLYGEIVGSDAVLLAGKVYWGGVQASDGANMGFLSRSAQHNAEVYHVGATDEHDVFGAGPVGTYFLQYDFTWNGNSWPSLTGTAIANYKKIFVAKTAALCFRADAP
jgi:hypothetical protein